MNRQARFGMLVMACAGCLASAPASALELAGAWPTPGTRVEQDASPGDAGARAPFATTRETRVWAGRGRLAVGIGIEQPWAPPASLASPQPRSAAGRLLLGVSLRTSERSRLIWQAPATANGLADAAAPGDAPRRPVLDLRHTDPYRNLLRGTFRYELAPGTALSLKANARRIGLALTRQW